MAPDELVSKRTRRIAAAPEALFAVLADPRRHPEFDGTGMLRGTDATAPVTGVGDTFLMRMENPEFGDYVMANRVVVFEPARELAWEPTRHDDPEDDDWHHRWGFELAADGDGTVVTEYFDLSRSPEDAVRILRGGHRWDDDMVRSLELLAGLVEG